MIEIPQDGYAHDSRANECKKERHDDSHERNVERTVFFNLSARYATYRNVLGSYGKETQQKQNDKIDISRRTLFSVVKLEAYDLF